MKKRISLALVACLAFAQGPTQIQQDRVRIDAANQVTTIAGGATGTLTPNGGEFVYVYEMDVQNCADATGVTATAVETITTTNLTGSPVWTFGSGATAGGCTNTIVVTWPTGLRSSTPGTATTFVVPANATHQTQRVNVAWRSAP